jgi:phenylpyruvate tautomerase PptA (4-oxalocrotonate tautomerase family)
MGHLRQTSARLDLFRVSKEDDHAVLSMHHFGWDACAKTERRDLREITRIHCETTGALPRFVQIQFEEVKPGDTFQNGKPSRAVRLHGRIRAGRDADTKHRMLDAYTDLIVRIARVSVDDVMVALVETPHENAMEGGVRLPAPGEEEPWL